MIVPYHLLLLPTSHCDGVVALSRDVHCPVIHTAKPSDVMVAPRHWPRHRHTVDVIASADYFCVKVTVCSCVPPYTSPWLSYVAGAARAIDVGVFKDVVSGTGDDRLRGPT